MPAVATGMGLSPGARRGGESLILSSAQRLSPLLRSRRGVAGMSRQEEATVGTAIEDDAAAFHEFFERHYAELARLAALLTGEADAADDLAADALVVLWRQWDRVRAADHPVAYARGVVANLARSR